MAKKKLTEIFDINFLQRFQDAFADATGMASIISDLDGPVTDPSNFTEFCIDKTRGTELGLKRCVECDLRGGEQSKSSGRPAVYFCHAGLMDFAAPIVVDGEQVGSILGGQVLPEPPNENKFRRIAEEIGLDPDEYIAALRKVKVLPEKQIRQAAELMYICMSEIGKVQTQFYKLERSHDSIQLEVDYIDEQVRTFADQVGALTAEQKNLLDRLTALHSLLVNINRIVNAVAKISQKTKLISFNASVEAARSGASGKGFAVIAQEIRNLADETTETLSQIEGYTQQVLDATAQVVQISTSSTESLTTQMERLESIFPHLTNIVDEVASLKLQQHATEPVRV